MVFRTSHLPRIFPLFFLIFQFCKKNEKRFVNKTKKYLIIIFLTSTFTVNYSGNLKEKEKDKKCFYIKKDQSKLCSLQLLKSLELKIQFSLVICCGANNLNIMMKKSKWQKTSILSQTPSSYSNKHV